VALKEHSSIGKMAFGVLDALLLTAAFYLGYYLFSLSYSARHGAPVPPVGIYIWLLFVLLPSAELLLNHYELLAIDRSASLRDVALRTGKTFLLIGVLLSGVIFLTKAKYYSRLLLGSSWLIGFGLVMSEKLLLHYLGKKGLVSFGPVRAVALVGEGERFQKVKDFLRAAPAYVLSDGAVFDTSVSIDEFRHYLLSHATDEVFFVLPRGRTRAGFEIDRFLRLCESVGVPVRVAINMDEVLTYFSCSFSMQADLPMVVFHPLSIDPDRAALKRLMDLVGAALGLLGAALVSPFIAFLIKLDSRGPIFFVQERIGQNGRRFRIYKFRTMFVGAEQQQGVLAVNNEMAGPIFKLSNDPRVTRAGRFLRRFSLDELPQFWNVLKGDMSLVGTRPPTPREVRQYKVWHYRRISIRPGMTGLWQVSGRNKIRDFNEIVRLDLRYIDEWSLWLDLKILLMTLFRFARGQ